MNFAGCFFTVVNLLVNCRTLPMKKQAKTSFESFALTEQLLLVLCDRFIYFSKYFFILFLVFYKAFPFVMCHIYTRAVQAMKFEK